MLVEKIIFNILAFSLFILILFRGLKKKNRDYIGILILQFIGIFIDILEIGLTIRFSLFFLIIRYVFSIVLPVLIIYLEKKDINFSEIISIFLARFFISIGNNKKAKQILIHYIKANPNSCMSHKILGFIYEKEGGLRKAIDEYVYVIDSNKTDYLTYFKITKLLDSLDKKDEAIEMLKNLLRVKPDYYEASIKLGDMLCIKERFKEAANVYQNALRYYPEEYDLYYNLGIVYTRLSDFQSAKEMYERAAEINHKLYMAYYSLGVIAICEKDLERAKKYFQQSIYEELEPASYYQLAKVYMLKKEKDMAINFLNKAIELDKKFIQKASNEPIFNDIKQYITVCANMNEEPIKKTLSIKETQALVALEDAILTADYININSTKQRIDEKVDKIFDMEKLRKSSEEEINFEKNEKNKNNS